MLNEAAQRLGVSLRQTEDELTRNMLAATASFINATGGTNGRDVAVVKSSLIEVEPHDMGDTAQAEHLALAA